MEIKEGMYVRTRINGSVYIRKVIKIEKSSIFVDKLILDDSGELHNATQKEWISKVSYNIIDLIKEGDYVNGKIVEKDKEFGMLGQTKDYGIKYFLSLKDIGVKTIITKEEFKNREYEVK